MHLAAKLGTVALVAIAIAPSLFAQTDRSDQLLPGAFAAGVALQVTPSLSGVGTARAYLHPVILDASGSRTIGGRGDKLTMASIDASIPWSQRRGIVENTTALTTLGLGLTLVDTESASAALGPSFVSGGGMLVGRSLEVFATQRIGVVLLSDENAPTFGTGDVFYSLQAGFRIYP